MSFAAGEIVAHPTHGRGQVLAPTGATAVVRFESGLILQCALTDLSRILAIGDRIAESEWSPALPLLLKAQAEAVLSVNRRWGVFARSRIALLPHQLWVCHKLLQRWPARWLVADDVGLGKTIEAGLLLVPLLSSGKVRRALLLCPASLVEQWQARLREMFDIRLSRYTTEADTARGDFWNTHNLIVASTETLRRDRSGRWARLLEAEPWDLLLVDEAHHLNADEDSGPTLAYELARELETKRRLTSMVFFTGTPHRGKHFGFFALLRLLRPDLFDPDADWDNQMPHLRDVMIRNNKRNVTTMTGATLFTPVTVTHERYSYSPAEAEFYSKLTAFIAAGRAFASTLGAREQRTVMLVLITMQKLASSSAAAIRHALGRRLARLKNAEEQARDQREQRDRLRQELEAIVARGDASEDDRRSQLEEQIAELAEATALSPDEIPALEELLECAAAITSETKISRVVELLQTRFQGESVLLFTEYKATQALLLRELEARFGSGVATFINGDECIELVDAGGQRRRVETRREDAAARFNRGLARFLVSTEAAGEGIDLQESCATLIHVDLPWNPMRLHQRVGRVSRYGQTRPVTVLGLLNADTVEGRIWQLLNEKLERITAAFRGAMDDPEDMLQAVLGMTPASTFERLRVNAPDQPEGLKDWFRTETQTFGGEQAIEFVKRVFGNAARFEFGAVAGDLPKTDLPDLRPFLKASAVDSGRRPEDNTDEIAFLTPDTWRAREPLLPDRCRIHFDRKGDGKTLGGVGNRVVDTALKLACEIDPGVALVAGLETPVAVIRARDQASSGDPATAQGTILYVEGSQGQFRWGQDWEAVLKLNPILDRPVAAQKELPAPDGADVQAYWVSLQDWTAQSLPAHLPELRVPESEVLAVFWPARLSSVTTVRE